MRPKDQKTTERSGPTITIVEVAERAGVSIKTVSRVVNGEPNVREGTRERVEEAIRTLGYRPNPSARSLAANRSWSIGLIYEMPQEFGYVRNAMNGVASACDAEGYSLLMRPCAEKIDLSDIEKFITLTRIDGAVLTAPICDDEGVTGLLEQLGVPFARLAPASSHAGWISAQCDDESASHAITEYLWSLGHRRIGFIKGHPAHSASAKRLAGYIRCLEDHDHDLDPELVRQGYFEFDSGRDCARELLQLAAPPTAVFASNDDMAAGVVFVARERGLAIPEDLSIAGFDDSLVAERTWPPLTTVRQPVSVMAEDLTHRLIMRLRHREREGDRADSFYLCKIVVRDSTGPCRSDPEV